MSMSHGDGGDGPSGSGAAAGPFRRSEGGQGRGGGDHGPNGRGGGHGRKKRRRQRPQRPKHRKMGGGGLPKEHISFDSVNRERIFQQIEGLLRQIREDAEEFGGYTPEQLNDYTQTVTAFTRALEEEGEPMSDRIRSEYLRVRDKLSNALRN